MIHNLKPYPAYKDSGIPWLGQVPEHWEVKRQRNIVKMLVSNVDKHVLENEDTVRLCNYTDVYKNDKITERITFMRATASIDEIRRFKLNVGDVIITKDSETWNDIAVPALVEYEAPDLICGYHLAILRPFIDLISGGYLFRALQSQGVESQYYVSANGVTRYGLSHEAIKSVLIPVPPLPEQSAIVRYLDYMDRRIRRYIHAKQKLIKLLEEQKQVIIHRAVTRGLDPDVKLKPSGVEWLGNVPEHWEMKRAKQLCEAIIDCKNRTPDMIDNGEYTVVRTTCIRKGKFDLTGSYPTDKHNYEIWTQRGAPQAGDVFFTREAPAGEACLVPDKSNLCMGQRMMYFRPDPELLNPRFLLFSIYGPVVRTYVEHTCSGSTVSHLRLGQVYGLPILWCPVEEQRAIVAHIEKLQKQIDKTISCTDSEISLLREYRTRLIADVVTGKLDVREAAASLPDEVEEPEVPEDEESTEVDPESEPEENIGED